MGELGLGVEHVWQHVNKGRALSILTMLQMGKAQRRCCLLQIRFTATLNYDSTRPLVTTLEFHFTDHEPRTSPKEHRPSWRAVSVDVLTVLIATTR